MAEGTKGNRDQGEGGGDPAAMLRLKVVIFALGAAFGVGGMASELRLFTWIGIAILFVGVLLRFLPHFRIGSDSHSAALEEEGSLGDDTSAQAGSSTPPSPEAPRSPETRSRDS